MTLQYLPYGGQQTVEILGVDVLIDRYFYVLTRVVLHEDKWVSYRFRFTSTLPVARPYKRPPE